MAKLKNADKSHTRTEKRHIMPFFIPMEGCKNRCIYCDQMAISGANKGPTKEEIALALELWFEEFFPKGKALENLNPSLEVAFYGGSFTALPQSKQEYYLKAVKPYLDAGKISGLRISTHPGAIDRDRLDFLKSYRVNTIELGVQSFNDRVLAASGRGYSGQEGVNACRLVKEDGFILGIQLMTGLPEDNPHISLSSAFQALEIKPHMARLYPTLVLPNTPLAQLWELGKYQPQTLDEAVSLARDVYACFKLAGVPLIRMGLNPSPGLEEAVLAGPYHPAFGNLVLCSLKKLELSTFFKAKPGDYKELNVAKGQLPLFTGANKTTRSWLLNEHGIGIIKEDQDLPLDTFKIIDSQGNSYLFHEEDFLNKYCGDLRKTQALGA